MTGDDPLLGIVVPTLNEAGYLPSLLDDLTSLPLPHRTVVVDGGSSDGTRRTARERGVEVLSAPRGRSSQLNAGAGALSTPWLLFLHADVRLPRTARRSLVRWLEAADPGTVGYFGFRLAGEHWFWRFIEFGQRIRERVSGLAYGDQGLVVHRSTFEAVGGYPDLPVMEDVEMLRRLRSRHRVRRIPAELVSSPRRYEREGRWLGWMRNTALVTLYLAGVPPRLLSRWYRSEPEDGEADPNLPRDPDAPAPDEASDPAGGPLQEGRLVLLVFAKSPEAGRVKTRLAEAVGADRAARIYRQMGRRVVDQVRGGPYRTVVCYDPPGAEQEVRSWLGGDGMTFWPQEPGDLGARMAAAFRRAFRDASRVCVIGTDAPGVGRSAVAEAFRALESADVVLGPASDGGYYLLALDRPRPELFRDVPWSTSDVLSVTRERASAAGLRVHLLSERTDLDTGSDLEKLGLGSSPADRTQP